mgnify:CR=1 FL=1
MKSSCFQIALLTVFLFISCNRKTGIQGKWRMVEANVEGYRTQPPNKYLVVEPNMAYNTVELEQGGRRTVYIVDSFNYHYENNILTSTYGDSRKIRDAIVSTPFIGQFFLDSVLF